MIICSMNKQWTMIASDIDSKSIDWAQRNIDRNNLNSRIFSKYYNRYKKMNLKGFKIYKKFFKKSKKSIG